VFANARHKHLACGTQAGNILWIAIILCNMQDIRRL
jgi:hypothetical protein